MHLTKREEEVLELISQGYSNTEIVTKLFVSTHTVKAHSESIYYKIGARNRAEATRLYLTKEIKNML